MNNQDFSIKNFGDLEPGDFIVGSDGMPVEVKTVYEPHIPERMYELEFEDGTLIKASGNHLWYIEPVEDVLSHSARVQKSKKILGVSDSWIEEALFMAESENTPYEIGFEDLMNFFDFIDDINERYFFVKRILDSVGHVVEEEVTLKDPFNGVESTVPVELVYDARRVFQQALSLTGKRKYRKKWPVIVGRVVTTDQIFTLYPDAEIPTPKEV